MEFACSNFRNYLKNQPIDKEYDAKSVDNTTIYSLFKFQTYKMWFRYYFKQLCAKFTTENVFKCAFSFDAGCFEPGKNEFREIGKKIFAPSLATAFRFLISPILPKSLFNFLPIP